MSYADWVGDDRRVRAYRMYTDAVDHHIVRTFLRRNVWIVRSQRRAGITYSVNPAKRTCTCADFRRNAPETPGFLCKHLYLVEISKRGGRLLRVRGRAFSDGNFYFEDSSPGEVQEGGRGMSVVGRYAVKAVSPLHACVVDIATGEPVCGHAHEETELREWFTSGAADGAGSPCPRCIDATMGLLVVEGTGDGGARPLRVGAPSDPPGAKKTHQLSEVAEEVLEMYVDWKKQGMPRKFRDAGDKLITETSLRGPEMLGDESITLDDLKYIWKTVGFKPNEWSGTTGTTKEALVDKLVELMLDPFARQPPKTAPRALRQLSLVTKDSLRESLANDARNDLYRMVVYGHDRCNETILKDIGVTSLATYQEVMRWAAARSGSKDIAKAHSFLMYHPTGAGKTSSIWLMLGALWNVRVGKAKEKVFHKKFLFVTKRALVQKMDPAKDVWAFYEGAGPGARDAVRRTPTPMKNTEHFEQWMHFFPTPERGIDSVEPASHMRLMSYDKLYNACRANSRIGRSMYGVELDLEAKGVGTLRAKVMGTGDTYPEKGGKPIDGGDDATFLAELRKTHVLRSTQPEWITRTIDGDIARMNAEKTFLKKRKFTSDPDKDRKEKERDANVAKLDTDIAAKKVEHKKLLAVFATLVKSSERLLETKLAAKHGLDRNWKEIGYAEAPKPAKTESTRWTKDDVGYTKAKQGKRRPVDVETPVLETSIATALADIGGRDALAPIDPLRDAVIAIDEADVLFRAGGDIGNRAEVIEQAIYHSYDVSFTHAVRVILATATPAHTSVDDTFRLLNLLVRDKTQRVSDVGSAGEDPDRVAALKAEIAVLTSKRDASADNPTVHKQIVAEIGAKERELNGMFATGPSVADLAGPSTDFGGASMWEYANIVQNAIAHLDLVTDFDHFPHRVRETVHVDVAEEFAGEYDVFVNYKVGGEAKEPKARGKDPGDSSSSSESDPEYPRPKPSEAASALLAMTRDLRAFTNMLAPDEGGAFPEAFRLGHPKYDPVAFAKHVTDKPWVPETPQEADALPPYGRAPKVVALLRKIHAIDSKYYDNIEVLRKARDDADTAETEARDVDMAQAREHAALAHANLADAEKMPPPKHAIICEAPREYGAPLIAAALDVAGFAWRPFRRTYRPAEKVGRKDVATVDFTEVRKTSAGVAGAWLPDDALAVRPGDDDSNFFVLDPRLLDFSTETRDGGFARQARGKTYRVNTEYMFLAKTHLKKLLGEVDDEDEAVKEMDAIARMKIYRPNGSAAFGTTLTELFVEDQDGEKAKPSVAALAPRFFAKIGVDPATATLADLHGGGVVRWNPWMQTSQHTEAAKRVVEKFNSLEENDRAQLARIIVLSRDFTTGTDLFQTEHIHLFDAVEPVADGEGGDLLTRDRIQMEGRAWRRCGHSYLRSLTNEETVVNVYEYRLDAGAITAQKALDKYIRKKRINRMADTANRATEEWRIDDVVQALRTDPADFDALSKIDSFMRFVAFDADANRVRVYGAPVYTGYTLTDSASGARPLYRRSTGELVSVNDEPIAEIAHFDDSLLHLWKEKRAMWDQYAGAWKGVADREQGAIEAAFAGILENHVESLLRFDAQMNPGTRMDPVEDRKGGADLAQDTIERLQEIRGWAARIGTLMDTLDVEMSNLLSGTRKGGKSVAKKDKESAEYKERKSRKDDLDARKKPLDKLTEILERDLLGSASASADAVGTTGEGGGALKLWRERASFYRRTRTLLPLASDVKDAPMKQEVVGWYDVVKGATVSASAAAGFQLRKDRVRDLWFASHIDDRWDINVFEDIARAAKRMLFAQSKKVRDMSMARYIEIALGPKHYPDIMASTPKIQNVIRIAGWVNPGPLGRDIGYFVDYLGMTIDKVIEDGIIRYGIVPGESEVQRRVGIAALLANRERVNAEKRTSLWKRLILSAKNVFGKDFDVSMARLLATTLTKWHGHVVSWKARSAARARAPDSVGAMGDTPREPDVIDALYAIADHAARFFANRAAPTRVFAIMRTVGAEFGVKYPMFIAEFLNSAVPADANVTADGAAAKAVAAIAAVMERRVDDFTEGTRCAVVGRDDAKFDKLRNAGRAQSLPTATAYSAVRALSDANGSWVEAVGLLPGILLTGSRLHIRILADPEDARLEDGVGADIFMDTEKLKGTNVTKELYFYNKDGERQAITPNEGVGWLGAIRDWLAGGDVCIANGVKFLDIVEKRTTATTEIKAATTAIVKRLAPGWKASSMSTIPGDVAKLIYTDRFEVADCYDDSTVESYLTLYSRQLFGQPFGDLSEVNDGREAKAVLGAINAASEHWDLVANVARHASRVLYKLTVEAAMRWITDTAASGRLVLAKANANDTPALATAISGIFKGMKDVNGARAYTSIRAGKTTDGMTVLKWALAGPLEMQDGWDLINEWADNERKQDELTTIIDEVEQIDMSAIGALKTRNAAIVKELAALGPLKMPRVIGMEPTGETDYVGRLLGKMRKWKVATEEMKQIYADQNGGQGLSGTERDEFLDRKWAEKRAARAKAVVEMAKDVVDGGGKDTDFIPGAEDPSADDLEDVREQLAEAVQDMDRMTRNGEDTAQIAAEIAKLQADMAQVVDANLTGGSASEPMIVNGRIGGGDGARIVLIRAQPLRLASPAHMRGHLVPVHIATDLVWAVRSPMGRTLKLASGRAVLPSGCVLDPWEEEEDIVVEFF